MSLPVALAPGTIIANHYIVDSLISSGGFGAVYRGIDTSEGNRLCAIKETYDVTPAARRQALMEASVLFTVRSAHLPQVYDALEDHGRFYLIMQLVEGQTLLQLLLTRVSGPVGLREPHRYGQGPCTTQEVLSWLLPIMDVLHELHTRKPAIVHRDIKPGNIILTPQNTTVLVDFGLTKLYDPHSSTQTLVKAVSEGYSPLEQYVGKTDPRTDIYAMAATMYILLTDRLPPVATRRGVHDELIPPRQLNPSLSPRVEQVLLKALSVHADQRYNTMQEFAQALQEPSFTGYGDPTVAFAPSGPHSDPTIAFAPPTIQNLGQSQGQIQVQQMNPPVQAPPTAPQPQIRPIAPPRKPAPSQAGKRGGQKAAAGYPGAPVGYPYLPPGYPGNGHAMPHTGQMPVYALPTPFGQGCLWGLVQGLLAATMVLFLRGETFFYLAVLIGFCFYVLAGFTTTWRGGSSFRGAWAGFWAGSISTIMFWITLYIGVFILVLQRLTTENGGSRRGFRLDAIPRAWNAIFPPFPHIQPPSGQSPLVSWLLIIGGGMLLAYGLGLLGGLLGRSYRMSRQRQP